MRPPSHSTAELYAELSAAWSEFRGAKEKGDEKKVKTAKERIKDLQKKLDLAIDERDFEQAV
jgi:hypothetical protein